MGIIGITCVSTKDYEKTIFGLKQTIKVLKNKVKINRVYWFSDIDFPDRIDYPVKWIKIDKFNADDFTDQYNNLSLNVIPRHCFERHNLIVQSDGFAVNSDAWTDDFLNYDYIGAAWLDGLVGNSGFCLRSRKLYNALIHLNLSTKSIHYEKLFPDIKQWFVDIDGKKRVPDDVIICRIHRQLLIKNGIKFAPVDVADRFSIEHHNHSKWLGKSLGFHGRFGIAKHYGFDV